MNCRQLLAAVCILSFACSAHAAVITTYDFTGAAGDQASTSASSVASGLTAGVLIRGPGVTAATGANSINSTAWSTGGLDFNDYYGFTLTPGAGATLNVDSISFSERRSATGIKTISVRSSLDNFASDLFTTTVLDDTLTRRQSVTLGSAFDALTSAVTFRIYGYNAEAAGGSWRLGVSTTTGENTGNFPANLVVDGSITAVPEPGTLTLLGLGALSLLPLGRRQRQSAR
jgi:hypothetical protein